MPEEPICEAMERLSKKFEDRIISDVNTGLTAKWKADVFKTVMRDDLLFLTLIGSIRERLKCKIP